MELAFGIDVYDAIAQKTTLTKNLCNWLPMDFACCGSAGHWLAQDGETHQSTKKLDEKKALVELHKFAVKSVAI